MTWHSGRVLGAASIELEMIPPVRYRGGLLLDIPEPVPDPENPTPQQLRTARKRADKKIQIELGATVELVLLGDVVTFGLRFQIDWMQ